MKSPWMQKQNKIFQSEKKFSKLKKLEHCIYFETLYLFRGIVLILRHCIHFKTLYLFRDIIFISRHCIYLEILYLFRDIVFISRHCIYFETLHLFRDIAFISRYCIYFETHISLAIKYERWDRATFLPLNPRSPPYLTA